MAIVRELPVIDRDDQDRPLSPSKAESIPVAKKPEWIKIRPPSGENYQHLKGMLRERKLFTVCEEARCPNLTECWAGGTATFMLGGDTCTRACRFCHIKTARNPLPLDSEEPLHVAQSVSDLGLKYIVLTSVDRDDLKDGMSGHFAETIVQIKKRVPQMIVEALVPDFRGDRSCIETIVNSDLDVYAHNIETVRRLQYRVRDPRAFYEQSLETLRYAKAYAKGRKTPLYTKSSIMVGLGESWDEIEQACEDLRKNHVDVVTFGQYLRPTQKHLPVEKFYTPEEFEKLQQMAEAKGFLYVASGVMVRSSYKAAEFFMRGVVEKDRADAQNKK
ncbi:MAG: lipoyl synthase [Bdellovibrionaceae bacterium]|nr:lipoyl synthase [Pseudobdellovibrionaceae bacterium]